MDCLQCSESADSTTLWITRLKIPKASQKTVLMNIYLWYNILYIKNESVSMGRKTKFPLWNLFYWSIFCIVFFFLLAPSAKASLLSDIKANRPNQQKTVVSKKSIFQQIQSFGENTIRVSANFGKTLVSDIKDFGATVGETMGDVGSTFESTIKEVAVDEPMTKAGSAPTELTESFAVGVEVPSPSL